MKNKKIYVPQQLELAVILGSPWVAFYFAKKNFEVFNQPERAKKTLKAGIIIVLVLLISVVLVSNAVPENIADKIPIRTIFGLVYIFSAIYIYRNQAQEIDSFLQAGGERYSYWKVIGFSLLIEIILFAIIVTVVSFISNIAN